ncbi:MAG: right-handed parallel beta-helix repeat-containing protein, partial [Firmicutes bacterium]|nr:right-handed parallel beta-helix repeat-containing protein [Bacillota bacterium]
PRGNAWLNVKETIDFSTGTIRAEVTKDGVSGSVKIGYDHTVYATDKNALFNALSFIYFQAKSSAGNSILYVDDISISRGQSQDIVTPPAPNNYNEILHGVDATGIETKIFWNDSEMTLSRYPNYDTIPVGPVIDPGPITKIEGGKTGTPEADDGRGFEFTLLDSRPLAWKDTSDIYIYGTMCFPWVPAAYKVRSVNAGAGSVRTYDTAGWGARTGAGNSYYFFNVFEELDVPGEWYLDRSDGKLYIYPYDNFSAASVYVSTKGMNLVNVDSARHVYFDGLRLTANSGAGFVVSNSENVVIQNCDISLMGAEGAYFNRCSYSGVTSSLIYNVDKTGVRVEGNDDKDNLLIPSRNFVQNNIITRQGNSSQEAGYMGGNMGDIVSHNLFQKFAGMAVRPTGNESIIEYNEIQGSPYEVADMGAIYTGGIDSPLQIDRYNYIHDMSVTSKMGNGIYYDAFGSGFIAYGNILNKLSTGIYSHGGRNNMIVNNIVAGRDNDQSNAITNSENYFAAGNYSWINEITASNSLLRKYLSGVVDMTGGPYSERYPMWKEYIERLEAWEAATNYGASGRTPEEDWLRAPIGSYITDNVSYRHGDFIMPPCAGTVLGFDKNFKTDADPGFVDYQAADLNLTADAAVFDPSNQYLSDFQDLPFDKMGLIPAGSWAGADKQAAKYAGIGISEAPEAVYPADGGSGQESFDKITLKWTDVLGAGRYEVTVSDRPDFSGAPLTVDTDTSSCVITSLTGIGQTYYWRVEALPMAKSLAGDTAMSPVYSFTTMTQEEMESGSVDTTALDAKIAYAEAFLANMTEGNEPGDYQPGTAAQLQALIDRAISDRGAIKAQALMDLAAKSLINGLNVLRKNVVVGIIPITDYTPDMWAEIHNPGPVNPEDPAEVTFGSGTITMVPKPDWADSRLGYLGDVKMGPLYSFGMKLKSTDGYFVMSVQDDPSRIFWQAGGYCVIINPITNNNALELQVYDGSGRWIIDTVPNADFNITPDAWHDYAFGTYADEGGVRIVLMVDGVKVINYLDTQGVLYQDGKLVLCAHGFNELMQVRAPGNAGVDLSALEALLKTAEGDYANSVDYTQASVDALYAAMQTGYDVVNNQGPAQENADQAILSLQAAINGLTPAKLICAVKSMLAKIAKPQQIPYTWDGSGKPAFATSNAAVCDVSQNGALIPLKAGIAVITITAPGGRKIVFAVTVTA